MHTLQKKNVYRLFWIRRLSIAIFFILLADMQMAYAWYPVCKQDTVNISCLHACSRWQARQLSGPHTAEYVFRVTSEAIDCDTRCPTQSAEVLCHIAGRVPSREAVGSSKAGVKQPQGLAASRFGSKNVEQRLSQAATDRKSRTKGSVSAEVNRSHPAREGGSMRPATTTAVVEGSNSGSTTAQAGSSNTGTASTASAGCSEPGPGGSVSVPCSILGIFPPSSPQYSLVPAANNSAPLWRVDPSPTELYAELNAASSAAQLIGAEIDAALQPPSADVPLLGDVTELPQSFIPGPPIGGPGSPGWEPGSPGWEPGAVPIHPESILGPLSPSGSVGAAFSAAAAIDQVANNDRTHAYSTMGAEAAKASTVEPIATNIAINAGMAALSIPYVGPAIAPELQSVQSG